MNSAMKQDHLTVLSEFLHKRENIDPARVTPEASLEELRVDSLLLLELLFEFEDRLGVKMPQDIPRPKTVGDLLGIVDKVTAGYGVANRRSGSTLARTTYSGRFPSRRFVARISTPTRRWADRFPTPWTATASSGPRRLFRRGAMPGFPGPRTRRTTTGVSPGVRRWAAR